MIELLSSFFVIFITRQRSLKKLPFGVDNRERLTVSSFGALISETISIEKHVY